MAKKSKNWLERLMGEFSTTALVLIPICIGINQIGRLISTALQLPIYLDTIGTVFMAMLAGPWVAGVGGFLTNVVTAIAYGRPTSVFFGIVQLAVGLIAGWFVYKGWLKKGINVLWTGALIAVLAALVSSVIVVYVRGGVSASGVDAVVAVFLASGQGFWASIISARILTEMLDKIIAVFIPWISVKRLPEKYARLFKYTTKIR
ncbi:MAG: ECF transporter S component [Candidatus Nanoarchaeia archaeon]|nr:ECF transporter S component [Candidatus Nanoarchaeia archaeon]MDD5054323.1 ECF transporter S component [Candidatus Nanoarchaeia archaeon]